MAKVTITAELAEISDLLRQSAAQLPTPAPAAAPVRLRVPRAAWVVLGLLVMFWIGATHTGAPADATERPTPTAATVTVSAHPTPTVTVTVRVKK
jgi:hypothetical protein